MFRPASADLPPQLREGARAIAARLASAGFRGWLVGGALRDLALGNTPHEIDMATEAHPEALEALFEHTTAVGKAFGTIVVRAPIAGPALDVQVTTFRSEHGASDQRRPDRVVYGATLAEDARRRDFTCNALYLDPLSDEFHDPEGGLADLERGQLRTVGEARLRFAEDGLRLLRLARFAAALELEVEPETLRAAREQASALAGVSPERILAELVAIFAKRGSARAFALLAENGLLERALPGQAEIYPFDSTPAAAWDQRRRALARLPEVPGPELGLALLYDPLESERRSPEAPEEALAALEQLRPPRSLRYAVRRLWRVLDELAELAALERGAGRIARARRVRLRREREWRVFVPYARACGEERGQDLAMLDDLEHFFGTITPDELHPEPLLKSGDLQFLGVPRGPVFGQLLEEAEDLQLEGTLCTRAAAKSWLAARAQELHEDGSTQLGGKRRRRP